MGQTRSWMRLGTRCYQGGSNGCWPDRMLLGTRRCQVGSDGGSSIMDASRKPTLLPGWQRWGKLNRGCFLEVGMHGCFRHSIADALGTGKLFQLAYMDAFAIRSRNAERRDEARTPEEIIANYLGLHVVVVYPALWERSLTASAILNTSSTKFYSCCFGCLKGTSN